MGLDTSTNSGGVAILSNGELVVNEPFNLDYSHNKQLFPAIQKVLAESKLTITDIDAISIIQGPGSFTGLRIGIMAVKTLAHFGHFKSIGISSLEALVYPFQFASGTICPMLDALRGDIYCAKYHSQGSEPVLDLKDCMMSIDDYLGLLLKSNEPKPYIFIGNAALLYKEKIEEKIGGDAMIPPAVFQVISPVKVAELGLKKLNQATEGVQNSFSLQPVYIRKPEAEIVWDKKHSLS